MAQLTEWQFRNTGCVVSFCPTASAIGKRVLNEGGNAVDAAVAVALALTVTYPQAGNIGGGGFMLIHKASGEQHFLDYRETAPNQVDLANFTNPDDTTVGGKSVCVPGTIAGLAEALAQHGTWSWDRMVSICIELADTGVWVSSRQGLAYQIYKEELERFDSTRATFLPGGRVPMPGTRHAIPELARTFRILADEGPGAFYTGRIAEWIVDEVQRGGGLLEMDDMAAYEARWRTPIRMKLGAQELVTAPLPSAGGFIVQKTLELIEGAGYASLKVDDPQRTVLTARAFRAAFWLRRNIAGDPDFMDTGQRNLTREMWLRQSPLEDLERELVRTDIVQPQVRIGQNRSTTHFCVLDREGNAVSNTYSLNTLFGSKLAVREGGFLLNNSMDDFSLSDNRANWYQLVEGKENLLRPGRRPVTSMTPTIVTEGKTVRLMVGGAGGPRIPTMVVQVLLNAQHHSLPVSMNMPRVHHQFVPGTVAHETSTPTETLAALQDAGFKLSPTRAIGIGAAIKWLAETDELSACLDPRFVALT